MNAERRSRKRVDVALPIKMTYNNGEQIICLTKNLSILGTYIEVNKKVPIGTAFEIEIDASVTEASSQSKLIKCRGVSFRCQSIVVDKRSMYGIGVFFRSFSEGGENNLSEYIDYFQLEEERKGKMYIEKMKEKQIKRKGGTL